MAENVYMSRMLKLQERIEETGFFNQVPRFIPQQYIDVGWGDQDTDQVALFGSLLVTSRCLEKPNCHFDAKEGIYYALLCFDADRVDCTTTGCYLHWLRYNVSGDTRYSSGRDVVRWQSPHPTDSVPHRFFFVVIHQSSGEKKLDDEKIISKSSMEGRSNFNFKKHLESGLYGHIIGVNCCRFSRDESVEKVVASLRDEVELDPTGKYIVAEIHNGKRVEFNKSSK